MAAGFKTGGRTTGTPNKTTADIKALAQSFGPAVIRKLAEMAGVLVDDKGKPVGEPTPNPQARTAAMKELLDRGFGKARQPISGPDQEDNTQPLQIVYRWAGKVDDDAAE
jgi:hypothetical protein